MKDLDRERDRERESEPEEDRDGEEEADPETDGLRPRPDFAMAGTENPSPGNAKTLEKGWFVGVEFEAAWMKTGTNRKNGLL